MSKMSELAASDEFIHKQKEVVDRLDTVVRDCTSFLDLKENWDSYGGATFSSEVVNLAVIMLKCLAKSGIHLPDVTPSPRGSIELEWGSDKPRFYLLIEILPSERFSIVYRSDSPKPHEPDLLSVLGVLLRLRSSGTCEMDLELSNET